MFTLEFFNEKIGNKKSSKIVMSYKDYEKEYFTGKMLSDFIDFDYENALEVVDVTLDSLLKIINPSLTIDKLNENYSSDMFDLQKIINFNKSFDPTVNENEKYLEVTTESIKILIENFIELNPLFQKYLIIYNEIIKDKNLNNTISLISFLLNFKDCIRQDKKLALKYHQAVDFCLYDKINDNSTPFTRFMKYLRLDYMTDKVTLRTVTHTDIPRLIKKKKSKQTGNCFQDFDYVFSKLYTVADFETALYLEFTTLIENDVTLKKCENCGGYFISTGRNKNLTLCQRKVAGSDKTCESVGSLNKHKKKCEENQYWKLWQTVQERNKKRKQNNKLTYNEYTDWVIYGGSVRDKAEKGEMSWVEFEKIMNYKPDEIRKWINGLKMEV